MPNTWAEGPFRPLNEENLLASASTVEGIQKLINKFWMSDNYRVDPETLTITNVTGHPVPTSVAVEKRGNRYRFISK